MKKLYAILIVLWVLHGILLFADNLAFIPEMKKGTEYIFSFISFTIQIGIWAMIIRKSKQNAYIKIEERFSSCNQPKVPRFSGLKTWGYRKKLTGQIILCQRNTPILPPVPLLQPRTGQIHQCGYVCVYWSGNLRKQYVLLLLEQSCERK